MKFIPLTQNKYAIVDDADYEWLNHYKWYASYQRGRWYARRNIFDYEKQKTTTISMHQMLLVVSIGNEVDHKDGNGLNNQRNNLRIATRADNQHNQRTQQRIKTSQYKGVHLDKQYNLWRAHIKYNGKVIHIGRYKAEKQAAMAYDVKAKELFGSFAKINIA
ncbi:MAG TPA: AP2 domain-containing protein [Sedimentisphaerales bacterium]|nr:AP2 domain-containing protein [Sedimentisphaerales bacterium]